MGKIRQNRRGNCTETVGWLNVDGRNEIETAGWEEPGNEGVVVASAPLL